MLRARRAASRDAIKDDYESRGEAVEDFLFRLETRTRASQNGKEKKVKIVGLVAPATRTASSVFLGQRQSSAWNFMFSVSCRVSDHTESLLSPPDCR
jgi:hypothetical protein